MYILLLFSTLLYVWLFYLEQELRKVSTCRVCHPSTYGLIPPYIVSCHTFNLFVLRGGEQGAGEQGRGFDDFFPNLKIYSLNA